MVATLIAGIVSVVAFLAIAGVNPGKSLFDNK